MFLLIYHAENIEGGLRMQYFYHWVQYEENNKIFRCCKLEVIIQLSYLDSWMTEFHDVGGSMLCKKINPGKSSRLF